MLLCSFLSFRVVVVSKLESQHGNLKKGGTRRKKQEYQRRRSPPVCPRKEHDQGDGPKGEKIKDKEKKREIQKRQKHS